MKKRLKSISQNVNIISGLIFTSLLLSACSSAKYMPPLATYTPADSTLQYSDSTIAEAFRQNPQIDLPVSVAVYDVGFESLEIADRLKAFEEISTITHISPALIEGSSYYERMATPWYGYRNNPPQTNPLQIRTLAAQSHSDIVIFLGTHHEVFTDTNLLSVLYIPIIPMLFVKGNAITVHSYVDMYMIDVRNGFIYNSFRTSAKTTDPYVKINYKQDIKRLQQKNVHTLKSKLMDEIERVLSRSDFKLNGD